MDCLSGMMMPSLKGSGETMSCCGCMCLCPSMLSCGQMCSCNKPMAMRLLNSVQNRIVLCNSFFGLDKPVALPPNVTMTGPLVSRAGDLQEALQN